MHQQRAFITSLEENTPPALLETVRPGFSKPAELAAVQRLLESDFDVVQVRQMLNVEQCWDLHTDYMEGLRKIELQLHELAMRAYATRQQQSALATAKRVLQVAHLRLPPP